MADVRHQSELPHLRSTRDQRTRIDLVKDGAMHAEHISADMITYQPGDTAARHYHKDCEHLFYVTAGEGILHVDDASHPLRAGSVALVGPGEIHWFENPTQATFTFLEFWAPPPTESVWVDQGDI